MTLKPIFFTKSSDLRKWFEKNYDKKLELLVGYYKVRTKKPSITWSQSVDEALCFGWIDGIRKSINDESYCIRFTPRKAKSIWSAINIKKVEALTKKGLMKAPGIEAFSKKEEYRSKIYSYEKEPVKLANHFEKKFKANKKAWIFFQSQAPSYQKIALHWVMNAKQETTRINRLNTLINDSEQNMKIKPLRYGAK